MYAFARGAASTCGCASAEGRRHPEPIPISVVRETARATQRRRIVETASLNHRGLRGKAEELEPDSKKAALISQSGFFRESCRQRSTLPTRARTRERSNKVLPV